jgi:transcriptional regulator with XRE-family HTH domain
LCYVTGTDCIGGEQVDLTEGTQAARLAGTVRNLEQTLAQVTMAEVVKEARARARLSMRALARRSGLSAAQVSRIEAGEVERPVAETLVKLAKALDRDAELLLVFAGHIRGARARQLLRQVIEARPELGRAEYADALARLDAEAEREDRLGEELAAAEEALAQAQRDLDEAGFEGERVAAKPPREAYERLREVGMIAQRSAVEVAQARRQFEQLDDVPSREDCALAGRLFLDMPAGGDHLEAWRQFSGQITPEDPELRQLLGAWRRLGHERRKKVLEFSQDQVALSLLQVEKAIRGSVETPAEAFETLRNLSTWTAENGTAEEAFAIGKRGPSANSKSGGR